MGFRKLKAYQKGFELAMTIFEHSKNFPKEEKYALTDQVRRSSRAVCANMSEAYRKRLYPNHFKSKLTDSDSENSETLCWLQFALACNYITSEEFKMLEFKNDEIGKLIRYMINNPEKFS